MDEPTSALSPAECARLFRIIGSSRPRASAIVYISHRIDEMIGSPTGSRCCATGGRPAR